MAMQILSKLKRLYLRYFYDNKNYAIKIGVKIGTNCSIGSRNFGSEPYLITIGNHVQITDHVFFFTHGGGWVFREEFPNIDYFGKITIKDNVYIGSGSYILPGVTVESNVIIGARSVVTKSVPSGVIVAGNPAKIVGYISDFRFKALEYNVNTKMLDYAAKRKVVENLPEEKFIRKEYLK